MCSSLGMKVFDCFQDLINDKFRVVFIETFLVFFKDEVVEIATAEEREENDHGRRRLKSGENRNDVGLLSARILSGEDMIDIC